MKAIILSLTLLFLLASHSYCQDLQPLTITREFQDVDTDEWLFQQEEKFSYNQKGDNHNWLVFWPDENGIPFLNRKYNRTLNADGNSISSINKLFNEATNELEVNFRTAFEYNKQGELTRLERIRPERSKYLIEYVFNDNNCLVEYREFTAVFLDGSFEPYIEFSQKVYTNNSDCMPIRIENRRNGVVREFTELVYNTRGLLISETYNDFDDNTGDFVVEKTIEYEYDSQDRLILKNQDDFEDGNLDGLNKERYSYDGDDPRSTYHIEETFREDLVEPSSEEEQFYTITPNGELLKTKDSRTEQNWGDFERTFEYSFDDQDNVVKKKITVDKILFDIPDSREVYEHDLTRRCDGQLMQEIIINTENTFDNSSYTLDAPKRVSYYYGKPAACESQLENFTIYATPNPTKDFVNIQSDLLYCPGTELRIFAANGALVNSEDAWISENYEVRLPNLANGIYILQLFNEEIGERLSVSIVILN